MKLYDLLDNAKCYEHIRHIRWPEGVKYPHCQSDDITLQGKDDSQPERQRYRCKTCQRRFDDLTLSVFSGHHQPLKMWICCLHLMSLNVSNRQIAHELDLNASDVQKMTQQLRESVCEKRPEVILDLSVMKSMWLLATRVIRTQRAKKPAERCTGAGNARKREAAHIWHDCT